MSDSGAAPIPFFVGVGRSGTTLLRAIFNAHPDLAVANESRFPVWMAQHRNRYRYSGTGSFDTERFLADLLENQRVPSRLAAWELSPEAVRAGVREARPPDLASGLRAVYLVYAGSRGKSRFGDKTPRFVQHVDVVAGLFDEARIVHLVRDGRDVALAVGEVDFGAANVTQAAHRWARRVRRAERMGARLGPSRYRLVRYEDLTGDPEGVVRDLCRFLELDYDPAMLRYHEHPREVFAGLDAQAHHESLRLPVTPGLRDWRSQMPPADLARFEEVAGPILRELGYELGSPPGAHRQGAGARVAIGLRVVQGKAVALGRARRRSRGRERH